MVVGGLGGVRVVCEGFETGLGEVSLGGGGCGCGALGWAGGVLVKVVMRDGG